MSEHQAPWETELVIASETGAGKQVLDAVLEQLDLFQWPQQEVFAVQLALEEALVNAIRHGNKSDTDKRVFVSCRVSQESLRVEIRDEGQGFDLTCVPDPTDDDNLECPSGRGIMLMRSFMSRVEFNESGNCVTMEKIREPAP